MDKITRRRFLQDTAALLAAASVPGYALAMESSRGRRVGPNERIRIAVIGFHGQGMSHIRQYAAMEDVVVAALCDVDEALWEKGVKAVEEKGKPAPRCYKDVRKLLEAKDIDAVSIATPNHWHALGAIWAMQAGKDVYVEKPVSHNVLEGRRIVEASRKYDRICQYGVNSRSNPGMREAMAFLHSGGIGKIYLSRGLCYKTRRSIGKAGGEQPVPETVGAEGYDLWLGPAPKKPILRKQFHYDWHWFWDYGNGDLGNQGIHEMDKARWGINQSGFPKSVIGLGGRFGYEDDGETPNTELVFLDYGDTQIIFEVRGLVEDPPKDASVRDIFVKTDARGQRAVGNVFFGEKGILVAPSYSHALVYDNDGNVVKEFRGDASNWRNFIDAVRSRKRSDQNAEIEDGHISSALCHLGNISYRLGTLEPFHTKTKAFGDNKEAYETFGRFEEHLAANGINMQNGTYRLGRKLQIDPQSESFIGDSEANALLTREYRAPFVVPTKV